MLLRSLLLLLAAPKLAAAAEVAIGAQGQVTRGAGRLDLGPGGPDAPDPKIALPAEAKWCEVKPCDGNPSFMMAVNGGDGIGHAICERGNWEGFCDANSLKASGSSTIRREGQVHTAIDIGANLGFWSFLLANAGFQVVTVEPMHQNNVFIDATLAANPRIASNIHHHKTGLGNQTGIHCVLLATKENHLDGIAECSNVATELQSTIAEAATRHYEVQDQFESTTLDELITREPWLQSTPPPVVDFVKMDVEGMENLILSGGSTFLSRLKPLKIRSEVWRRLRGGATPQEYLKRYTDAGYSVTKVKTQGNVCDDGKGATGTYEYGAETDIVQDYIMCRVNP